MQPEPLVDIVVPAYNEEKYLAECLESILAQTYVNWECTIVDNASTDRTFEIARTYADRDSRIRVVRNKALIPAIANFNSGLRQISPASKYCKMVLADDQIFPECLQRMVAVMEEYPSTGIAGAYGVDSQQVLWSGLPYPTTFISGREICRQRLMGGPYVFGTPTSVLYRADLIRNRDPFYSEVNMSDDSEVCFVLLKDRDFAFVHQILSFSRLRAGSMVEGTRELNSAAADILHEVITYGPQYLTPEEYEYALKATLKKYYQFLATNLLLARKREFWNYHKRRFIEEGVGFSRVRLAVGLVQNALSEFRRWRRMREQSLGWPAGL